jgi:hypothetical protein
MGLGVHSRVGRGTYLSMPWWFALLVYAMGAALLAAVVVIVAAIALAAAFLYGLALAIDLSVARIRGRPRRLGGNASAPGRGEAEDRQEPRGRSYYY